MTSTQRICRTCLNTSDVMYNLFGADSVQLGETKVSVAEFMGSCFQLAIQENDIFASKICDMCYQEIVRIYTFKTKCQQSHIVLSQLRDVKIKLRKVKTKTEDTKTKIFPPNHVFNKNKFNENTNISIGDRSTTPRIEIIENRLLTSTAKKTSATTKYVEIIEDPLNVIEFQRLGGNLLNSATEMDVDDVIIKEEELSETGSLNGENISHSFLSETSTIMDTGAAMPNAQESENHECPACPYVHVSEIGLKKHMFRDHMIGNECSICKQRVNENPHDHFSIHLEQNVDYEEMIPKITLLEPKFQCEYCPEVLNSVSDLNMHVAGYHKLPTRSKLNTNIGNNCNIINNVLETNDPDAFFNEIIEEIMEEDLCDDRQNRAKSDARLDDSEMNILDQNISPAPHKQISQEQSLYKCPICPESFSQQDILMAHIKTHSSYKPFKCDFCSQTFRFQHNLNCHMRFKHCMECNGDKDIDCKNCSMKTSEMKSHECETCHKFFNTKSGLFRHKKVHGIDMKFKCHLCPKSFNYKQILQLHMKEKHGDNTISNIPVEEKLECNECSETFDNRQALGEHLKALEPIRQHQCPHCPKCFEFHANLILHLSTHMVENGSWCALCSVKFDSERHLKTHIAEKHAMAGEETGCYKCEECGKVFAIKGHYEEHLRTHTKENPFECHICQQPFRYMQSLTRHMKTSHTDYAPAYQCQLCPKSFRDRCDLVKHFRSHTGEKPFECDICSDKFSDKIQLGAHKVLKHDGKNVERQYFKCDHCIKVFWTRSHFEAHQLTHSKQSAPSCDICGKSFRNKQSLKTHVQRLHPSNGHVNEYNLERRRNEAATSDNAVVYVNEESIASLGLGSNQLATFVHASDPVMNEMFDESSIEVA